MEIAPIPGIRAVPAVQPRSNGLDLPAVFAVPDPSRSGADTYNGRAKASTGGQDDEEAELEEEAETDEAAFSEEDTAEPVAPRAAGSPIDFFA
jgi:hypothetical protein